METDCFEKKNPIENCYMRRIGEWRIRRNNELEGLFQEENILNSIWNRRSHLKIMLNQNPVLRTIIKENWEGKKSFGLPPLSGKDLIRKDVEFLNELENNSSW